MDCAPMGCAPPKTFAGNRRRFPAGTAAPRWSQLVPFQPAFLLPRGCHEPRKQRGGQGMNREMVDAQVAVVIAGSRDG